MPATPFRPDVPIRKHTLRCLVFLDVWSATLPKPLCWPCANGNGRVARHLTGAARFTRTQTCALEAPEDSVHLALHRCVRADVAVDSGHL